MTSIQFRRRLFVALLLCAAIGGAIVRHFADASSVAHDVGTALMVAWIPIVGNLISYLLATSRSLLRGRAESGYATSFVAHILAEISFFAPLPTVSPAHDSVKGEYRATLVLGKEGFTARWMMSSAMDSALGKSQVVEVEFFAPAIALARFTQSTKFQVLANDTLVADGEVIQVLDPAATGTGATPSAQKNSSYTAHER